MKVAIIVGMPGSGKSEVLRIVKEKGIPVFNMGDVVTKIEPKKRGIEKVNEDVENEIRKEIRKKHGKEAIAVITAQEIEKMHADRVVIVGLHNFEELEYFRKRFEVHLIAIEVSKEKRKERTAKREERPLSSEDFENREKRYKEQFDIPEMMGEAEFRINNEGSVEDLKNEVGRMLAQLGLVV